MADGNEKVETAADLPPPVKAGPWGGVSPTIPLTEPITVHGEKVSSLTFRTPTGEDIMFCGVPCTLDFSVDPPKVQFNAAEMGAMIGQLAGANPAAVKSLAAQDWINCAWRLSRFFVPRLTN